MANDAISSYIKEINKAYQRGDATEHTHRPALKTLIESLGKKITATNEPKALTDCGKPDMKVSREIRKLNQTIGYIEAKDIGENLTKILKTEQIKKRYLPSLHNFILTDYIEFRWYVGSEHRMTVKLADETGGKFRLLMTGEEEFLELIRQFFDQEPVKIKSAKELADKMAGMAKLLRDIVKQTFEQEGEKGSLHGQYEAFKKVLLHDLEEDQFADIYAQTICYGLFAARCYINDRAVWGKDKHAAFHGVDGKAKELTRENAAYLLPKTNPFLRNIFGDIAGPRLDERIAWLVDDLISLLRNTNMGDVLKGFGRKTKRQDPVIHFYETFLGEYDAKLKKSRGVYYTPEPVVSYIVRSVDWILKEKFGLKKGLADNSKIKIKVGKEKERKEKEFHRCLILDPAAGTGTFIYEVIKQINKNMLHQKGAWSEYIKKHLLPRIFGFEIMMAPYAVCHMKLGLELADSGYDFKGDDRLGVYLTNTLEEAEDITGFLGFARDLAEEAQAANEVKRDMPIMVVLGNPPYSANSVNKGEWICDLVRESYYPNDEIKEKNPKLLLDDYVKFIRYGQHRIEQTGSGILAFITNHGYLDNPTFRGMRQQLMETFTEIYVLDLHGNTKKKEVCPDGSPDKNVFDIQQGVSIGIFVKDPDRKTKAKVYHFEIWGERNEKYNWLHENYIKTTNWKEVVPQKAFFLFNTYDYSLKADYDNAFAVSNIFPINSSGIKTHRDTFVIDFDEEALCQRINDFCNFRKSNDEIEEAYGLKNTSNWNMTAKRQKLASLKDWKFPVTSLLYRPFDKRAYYHHDAIVERSRTDVMGHLFKKKNIALVTTRIITSLDFCHAICTNTLIEMKTASHDRGTYIFPVYLYPEGDELYTDVGVNWSAGEDGRVPNLDKKFVEEFTGKLKLKFVSDGKGDLKKTFGPEDIFNYIYAVFHSPSYRKRYAEFLKIDFPRVPLTGNKKMFLELCKAGQSLVELHLMESEALEDNNKYPEFNVEGDNEVEKGYPKYADQSKEIKRPRVYINDKQYFEGVKPEVWEFHIGGYQVCEKWLKDRRERKLSFDDIEHYQKITVALDMTIKAMGKVDEIIESHGGWPIK
ncbi:N-6 DNA methylase [candidate division KSB1 bacterium]|nr:N-6 DNA methylase [candidate division KSB1 bacterium]